MLSAEAIVPPQILQVLELTLEEVKAKLADTTIKANLQRELASMNGAGQALKPPTEPPGRAAPGRAYEQ